MVNKLNKVLRKKLFREIKANIKQFLALIFIATLAVTLFVGLSSNAKGLQKRVDQLYSEGNIADVFIYVSEDRKQDYEYFSSLDGVKKVEKRFALDECLVYQNTGTLLIQDENNELCRPASLKGNKGAVLDEMFASLNEIQIGDEIKVGLPYSIADFLSDEEGDRLISYLDSFLLEGVNENPLRNNITFSTKITGTMMHPETVEREFSHGTCYLSNTVFKSLLKEYFKEAFISSVAEYLYQKVEDISLMNQYLIQVNEGVNPEDIVSKVHQYYHPENFDLSDGTIPSKYWGKYNDTSNTQVAIEKERVLINSEIFKILSYTNEVYQLISLNGNETATLIIDQGNVYLKKGDTTILLHKILDECFITCLTKKSLPSNAVMEQDIYQAKQLCIVFPTIFFIVAALVIMTSLSQTISRSRQEIGTLKALGVNGAKILFYYISLGTVLSLIGATVGAIIGPLIIPNIMNIKYSILYNLPKNSIIYPWGSILLCIGIFVILSITVTIGVTYSELKLKPVESMRPLPMKMRKEKRTGNDKKASTILLSLKMAMRNIVSKKARMLMVVFGVMGCTSLTVAGFGILDTINYGLNMDLYETYQADASIQYPGGENCYELLQKYDEVKQVQQFTSKVLRVQNEENTLDTYMNIYESKAEINAYTFMDELQNGIALADSIASSLNVKVNDQVSLIYLGKNYIANVDVIYESSYWLGIYTLKDSFKEIDFTPTGANVMLKEGVNPEQFKEKLLEETNIEDVSTLASFQKAIDDTLSSIKMMCNTVKVFAILLAIVVTYNLASLNFIERKRDISTLKVLGFSSREIGLSLVFELMVLTLVGVAFGLILGQPILYLIMSINETNLLHYIYHINWFSYLISVLITLGTSICVNSYSAYLAGKVDAVSALKSVE